jgi:hypothetical protein
VNKIVQASDKERQQIFTETAVKRGLTPAVIEKDFWVCWILDRLFSCPGISKRIIFKGGTSLSKVYGLIERFSEDIDLILDWRELCDEDPLMQRSKTKQDQFNKAVDAKAEIFLTETFYHRICEQLKPVCEVDFPQDKHNLLVRFPAVFKSDYLRPEILLETGPLAAWTPNEKYQITSYVAEEFPELFQSVATNVRTTTIERSFWEKVTILHHEAHRPENNPMPSRYSRHYYDVYCMACANIEDKALKDLNLLQSVVKFKMKFYPRNWARYDLAKIGTIKLVPPDHIMKSLKTDYTNMKEMIYGNYPSFEEIMTKIQKLENKINRLTL